MAAIHINGAKWILGPKEAPDTNTGSAALLAIRDSKIFWSYPLRSRSRGAGGTHARAPASEGG